jgi:hypothetical protein
MKIVQGLGLALALAISTAGCVQQADAEAGPPTTAVPNFGLPSPDSPTTVPAPEPFVAEDADFSAVFPEGEEPERQTQTVAVAGWHVPVTLYGVFDSDRSVWIGQVDYARISGFDVVTAEVLDGALDGSGEDKHATVVSRTPVDLVGAVGLDGVIDGDGFTVHIRLIGVGDRMWMIQGLVPPAFPPSAEYQTLLQTFQVL